MTTTTAFDWTEVAPSWDRDRALVERMKGQVSAALLADLHVHSGDRVLELGAGTGEFARQLVEATSPAGHVVASDTAAGMVALLRGTLDGVDRVDVAHLDATATGLPDASLDVVVSRMVLMLLERRDAALREARRVLAPGGRVGAAVWAGPGENPWLTYVGMAAMTNGLVSGGPPSGPGEVFSLADAAVLERLLHDAGFVDVVVRAVPVESTYTSTEEHFDAVAGLAGPLSAAIAAAPPDVQAAVRAMTATLLERHRTPAGYVVPGLALVCTGVSPPS